MRLCSSRILSLTLSLSPPPLDTHKHPDWSVDSLSLSLPLSLPHSRKPVRRRFHTKMLNVQGFSAGAWLCVSKTNCSTHLPLPICVRLLLSCGSGKTGVGKTGVTADRDKTEFSLCVWVRLTWFVWTWIKFGYDSTTMSRRLGTQGEPKRPTAHPEQGVWRETRDDERLAPTLKRRLRKPLCSYKLRCNDMRQWCNYIIIYCCSIWRSRGLVAQMGRVIKKKSAMGRVI